MNKHTPLKTSSKRRCEPEARVWDMAREFHEQGYQEIGSGCFATVFATDNPQRVVKVFETDLGYCRYLRFLMRARGKAYPKVYGQPTAYVAPDGKHRGYSVVLERLYKVPHYFRGKNFETVAYRMNDYLEGVLSLRDLKGYFPFEKSEVTAMQALRKSYRSDHYRGHYQNSDLGPHNVMMRADHTLVITDPYCG